MKALVCEAYGSVDDLVYRDMPDPVAGHGEVVVNIKGIGVNFPDGLLVEGKYQAKPECPFMPGGEFSGEVAELGEGVTELTVGDRVLGYFPNFGAYAEKVSGPVESAFKIPDSMSFEHAAALMCATGTAHHA